MNAVAYSSIIPINDPVSTQALRPYSQINSRYEKQYDLHWCLMTPSPHPCFNLTLLQELNDLHVFLKEGAKTANAFPVRYQVLASDLHGVFNLGGDLSLFKKLIVSQDKKSLQDYAYACISAIYHSVTLHQHGITQISLIQGDALGGGFECALSGDIVIAERSAKMGLPEVLFNLFPGMGAYSLLSRKIGPSMATRMMSSGKLYTAEEMYDLGVVDILAEDGHGEVAVYDYISKENRTSNAFQAIRKIKDRCHPVTWEELKDIVDIWVESALKLTGRDLRMMERLISRQKGIAAQMG